MSSDDKVVVKVEAPTEKEPAAIEMSTIESSKQSKQEEIHRLPKNLAMNTIARGWHSMSRIGLMMEDREETSSSKSFYAEMDPALLPSIIKKGRSVAHLNTIEEEEEEKCMTWGEMFKQPSVIIFIIGLIVSIVVMFIPLDQNVNVQKTFGVLLLMATCWVTEIIPLSITALLPVCLVPLLGISTSTIISRQYFNNSIAYLILSILAIFMFMSGFLLSLAMEHWNLHKRIAFFITSFFGATRSILFGVMFASWFLSMWISNTAAALMMVANVTALVETLEDRYGKEKLSRFSKAMMLGIAYSCNVGGFATLIGTPPNMTFVEIFNKYFPRVEGMKYPPPEISFSSWMFTVFPADLLLFIILWIYFAFLYCPSKKELRIDAGYCKNEYKKLGRISYEETIVFISFIVLALLWIFRSDMQITNTFVIPGWSRLFGSYKGYISDGTVGMTIVLLLFFIPTKKWWKRSLGKEDDATIMTWNTAKSLPWDLILLFGGGFALAEACEISGLSSWIGKVMEGMATWPRFLAVFLMSLLTCVFTAFTSNAATAAILLPVMVGISQTIRVDPLILMVPITIATSCDFLFPVGTPPNLIVFSSQRITMKDMFKAGVLVTIISLGMVMFITFVMLRLVFGCDPNVFPQWAEPKYPLLVC